MDVQRCVGRYIQREGLVSAGDRVVVGVSGGPDSLCLLHLLWASRGELDIEVHAAHLNHMIRGSDADEDARFVAELAAAWQVPCVVAARDVPQVARRHKLAIEEAARRVRYAFLSEVAEQVGATRIAVGHNAGDQSETVLMHWLRLIARPEGRGDLWLIRPLLETERADIERYCAQQGIVPRFDRSNLDTTLYRNKLRHVLLPYLEREFKPGFRHILRRSARVIRDDYDLLRQLADRAWEETVREASDVAVAFDLGAWRALHPSLQRATIRQGTERLRWSLRDVNYQHIEAAVQVGRHGAAGARATLPRGVMLTVGYTRLTLADAGFVPRPDFCTSSADPVRLVVPGRTPIGEGQSAEVRILARAALPPDWAQNTDRGRAYLDADVLGGELTLRQRRASDRFCPFGLQGHHKLVSELLINEKVPAWWRDQVPLLVRGDGEIMWVCGWRIDERARVREDTARVAVIHLTSEE
jgi:tRNA(Ile)-lysidine synthase